MFSDLNSLKGQQTLETDICVVGAGAAGIAFAREFLGHSASIVLLEGGGLQHDGQTQSLNAGENTGLDYHPLESVRLRFFGGTTNHWAGQSVPLDPIDFEDRPWVPDSGWPISHAEYMQYIPRAQQVCRLGDAQFHWQTWQQYFKDPLDDSSFSPVVLRYPDPITRFGQFYKKDIEQSENVHCVFNANATSITTNDSGDVEHIEARSLNGEKLTIKAAHFILACGAMQNVKLLLNSDIGNANGHVGKYFMEHPNFDSGVVELEDNGAYPILSSPRSQQNGYELRTDYQLNAATQEALGILNHTVFLVPKPYGPWGDGFAGSVARYWSKVERKIDYYLDTRPFQLRVRLEQAPLADSSLTLSKQKDALGLHNLNLHFKFTELEAKTISKVQGEFAKLLGARELGRMKIDFDERNSEWMNKVGWQFHHMGGTRMSENPEHGVVDSNCRLHEINNLYVASSSVFPTGGHANPTLSIVAFSLRLADHIKKQLA